MTHDKPSCRKKNYVLHLDIKKKTIRLLNDVKISLSTTSDGPLKLSLSITKYNEHAITSTLIIPTETTHLNLIHNSSSSYL